MVATRRRMRRSGRVRRKTYAKSQRRVSRRRMRGGAEPAALEPAASGSLQQLIDTYYEHDATAAEQTEFISQTLQTCVSDLNAKSITSVTLKFLTDLISECAGFFISHRLISKILQTPEVRLEQAKARLAFASLFLSPENETMCSAAEALSDPHLVQVISEMQGRDRDDMMSGAVTRTHMRYEDYISMSQSLIIPVLFETIKYLNTRLGKELVKILDETKETLYRCPFNVVDLNRMHGRGFFSTLAFGHAQQSVSPDVRGIVNGLVHRCILESMSLILSMSRLTAARPSAEKLPGTPETSLVASGEDNFESFHRKLVDLNPKDKRIATQCLEKVFGESFTRLLTREPKILGFVASEVITEPVGGVLQLAPAEGGQTPIPATPIPETPTPPAASSGV